MTRPFVLLSTQRSGSTWAIDMLNSHPEIVTYGKLLLQDGRGRPPFGAQDKKFMENYFLDQKLDPGCGSKKEYLYGYLDGVFKPRPEVSAAGFKLMYGQYGAYPHLQDYMLSNGIYLAHLIRRNYLDVIISREIAAARDVYHVRVGETKSTFTIRLNIPKLLDQLAQQEDIIQRARNRFSRLGLPYYEIFYEDLKSDTSNFDSLLRFLSINTSGLKLTSRLRKIVTNGHHEIVENYSQVKLTVSGTRFSNLLK